jgi:triosephosphate isomerase
MRRYFIAGNWKMNKTMSEARELAEKMANEIGDMSSVDVAIFPPFTAISEVYGVIKDSKIGLGAQNLWCEDKGAYTGEISPAFVADAGCRYVIIGHSERRKYGKESDELINGKIRAALKWELTPVVCVGETLEQREKGEAHDVIERELIGALKGLSERSLSKLILAYEPIWAIGTGRTATPEIAQEMHQFTRQLVRTSYGNETAANLRILYGGSVTPDNVEVLMSENDIDGALVGGASLNPDSWIDIVKKAGEKCTE